MNILYAILITLLVYPIVGTLLFVITENLNASIEVKVFIMTFGHPILAGILIWILGSLFNEEIAKVGVLLVIGTLLRIPFSGKKYFSNIKKESGQVTLEYLSELLRRKRITLATSEIRQVSQSKIKNLFDKPSTLSVALQDQTLKFMVLDKTRKIFL